MKPVIVAIVLLLAPLGAWAQAFPEGTGVIDFKEKFKAKGCGGFKDEALLTVVANGDGTWSASAPAGDFSGTMMAGDAKGKKWLLFFDGGSFDDYFDYLEEVATELCFTPVSITFLEFKKFELKFNKDRSLAKLKLKTKAEGTTAFGPGKGSHALKGKGDFTPAE